MQVLLICKAAWRNPQFLSRECSFARYEGEKNKRGHPLLCPFFHFLKKFNLAASGLSVGVWAQ